MIVLAADSTLNSLSGRRQVASEGPRLAVIKLLQDRGAKVNTTNSEGFAALTLAVKRKDSILVDELLSRGAHPLVGNMSAVYAAIKWKNLGMLKRCSTDFHTRGRYDDKSLKRLAARIRRDYTDLATGHPSQWETNVLRLEGALNTPLAP